MTNKKETANSAQIRVNRQKADPANLATRPALAEVGTLDQGVIIIKNVIDPTKVCTQAATERGTG